MIGFGAVRESNHVGKAPPLSPLISMITSELSSLEQSLERGSLHALELLVILDWR